MKNIILISNLSYEVFWRVRCIEVGRFGISYVPHFYPVFPWSVNQGDHQLGILHLETPFENPLFVLDFAATHVGKKCRLFSFLLQIVTSLKGILAVLL